jgi:hypothetical protein
MQRSAAKLTPYNSCVTPESFLSGSVPSLYESLLDSRMIEHSRDDEIDEIRYLLRSVIKSGTSESPPFR